MTSGNAEHWARRLGAALTARGNTLSVAESLTAGLVTGFVASIPGASAYLLGGATTYSTAAKATVLHVSERTLATFGAVSEETAREMAHGVADLYGADIGLSTTGVAGPGLQEEKPPGTLCVGTYVHGELRSCKVLVPGDGRNDIRQNAVSHALCYLLDVLDSMSAAQEQFGSDGPVRR